MTVKNCMTVKNWLFAALVLSIGTTASAQISYPPYFIPAGSNLVVGSTIQAADGSAAAPSYSFSSASGLGLYRSSTAGLALGYNGTVSLAVNGSTRQFRALSNGGFVWGPDTVNPDQTPDTQLTRASAGTVATTIGTGTATANIGGTYAKFVSGTGVGNGADTTNDALWTLTPIPANTFTANGDSLVLTLTINTPTGNNKIIGLNVGGTAITSPVFTISSSGAVWVGTITRVDSTHVHVAISTAIGGGAVSAGSFNIVVSDLTANTLAVVVTGASPTTGAANDVRLFSGVAEFKK